MTLQIQHIDTALKNANARWQARGNRLTALTDAQRRAMLGAIPSVEAAAAVLAPPMAVASAFDPSVDWRNRSGVNHVTSVKSQGGCGSCVSFGSCGLVESMAHIELDADIDLSEADSHFCSSHGAACGGWWPDECLDQIIARGVCDEEHFRYHDAFPNGDIWSGPPQCILAPDRDAFAVKITARTTLSTQTEAKNYLTTTGPVVGCFTVFDDFYSYETGVYHHVTGGVSGGHCVLIIGYSEAEQCWIGKNSWDTDWGMDGFFKMSYADLIFGDSFFPMYGANGVELP